MGSSIIELKNKLLKELEKHNLTNEEIKKVIRALEFSTKKHQGQVRKSGEPYIVHPLNVAIILTGWGLDVDSICAGLLHDVVEDTNTTSEEIKKEFGDVVEKLVNSVTKVSTFSNKNRARSNQTAHLTTKQNQADVDSIVKIFLGMSKDLRVILVKIADRLHNMRTIEYLKKEKQARIAQETKDIYANIAGRLGMYEVKIELENICMKILEPNEYKKIKDLIEKRRIRYQAEFEEIISKIESLLEGNHIKSKITSRIKSVASSSEKIKNNENINDLFAIRIMVDKTLDCYQTLGVIHSNFFTLQNSFKDFISNPKINLYQSLHTTIVYKGLNTEIQIRTFEMDKIANYGIASHWKYKDKHNEFDLNFDLLNSLFSNAINDTANNQEYLNTIKKIAKQRFINVFDINAMTLKKVPLNTKVIDYAYMLNKSKFDYVSTITVNDNIEKLSYVLHPGDNIAITYSSTRTITKKWELITNDATVKKYIHEQLLKISSNIEKSVDEFIEQVEKTSSKKFGKEEIINFIRKHFNIHSISEFLDDMRRINLSRDEILKLFTNNKNERKKMVNKIKSSSWRWLMAKSLFESNDSNMIFNEIKITDCCSKLPPLEVVGLINGDVLNVHRFNCSKINAKNNKLIVLKWDKDKIKKSNRSFKAMVIMTGTFVPDASTAIISTILRYKGAISKFNLVKDKQNKEFTIHSDIYVKNYSNLEKMMIDLENKAFISSWKLI